MKTKKTNVLHYGIAYFPYKGGSSARLHKLITQQPNTNTQIVTTTPSESIDLYDTKAIHRVKSYYSLETIALLLRIIVNSKIDTVILHNNRVALLWLLLIEPVIRRRKIIEVHNFRDNTSAKRLLSQILYSRVHNIVVMSKRAMYYVHNTYQIPLHQIVSIRNGVPAKTDCLTQREPNHKYTFSYIGSYYDWQGVSVIADAITLLPESTLNSIRFVFAGGGPKYEQIRAKLESYNNLDAEFLGWIDQNEATLKTAESDVILMPRLSTTGTEYIVPLKALEAVSLNRNIIASNVGGLTEALEGYPNVYFISPGQPPELATAIQHLTKVRPSPKTTIEIHYTDTWEHSGNKYESLYQGQEFSII